MTAPAFPSHHTAARTYAILEISDEAFVEIRDKLDAAGYQDQFLENGLIDLNGIAIKGESA